MRRAIAIPLLVIVLLAGGGAAVAVAEYDHARRDLIAPGVRIAGVPVGRLHADAARARVAAALRGPLSEPVVVTARGRHFTLSPARTHARVDVDALVADASNLVMLPIFLVALLAVRGIPALVYRRALGARRAVVAGILQSTSLPFIVAATAIGIDLGLLSAAAGAALVGAGLLSVLLFPVIGLALLRGGEPATAAAEPLAAT